MCVLRLEFICGKGVLEPLEECDAKPRWALGNGAWRLLAYSFMLLFTITITKCQGVILGCVVSR